MSISLPRCVILLTCRLIALCAISHSFCQELVAGKCVLSFVCLTRTQPGSGWTTFCGCNVSHMISLSSHKLSVTQGPDLGLSYASIHASWTLCEHSVTRDHCFICRLSLFVLLHKQTPRCFLIAFVRIYHLCLEHLLSKKKRASCFAYI